jgi:hypothetical protein
MPSDNSRKTVSVAGKTGRRSVLAVLGAFALHPKAALAESPLVDIIDVTITSCNPTPTTNVVHIKHHSDSSNVNNNDTVVFTVTDNEKYRVKWVAHPTGAADSPFDVSGSHEFDVSKGKAARRRVKNHSRLKTGTYQYELWKYVNGKPTQCNTALAAGQLKPSGGPGGGGGDVIVDQ